MMGVLAQGLYYSGGNVDAAGEILDALTNDRVLPSELLREHYKRGPHQYNEQGALALSALASVRVAQLVKTQRIRGVKEVPTQAPKLFSELQSLKSRAETILRLDPGVADDPMSMPSTIAGIHAALAHLQLINSSARAALASTPKERSEHMDLVRARAREMQSHYEAQQRATRREFAREEHASLKPSRTEGVVVDDTGVEFEGFHVGAALNQAAAAYFGREYAKARGLYARAIRAAPQSCPASARVGLGLCLMKLGHEDVALAAMRRALQLDPSLPSALASFSMLRLIGASKRVGKDDASGAEAERAARREALVLLSRAVEVDGNDPTALLALAQLLFWSWIPLTAQAGGGGDAVQASIKHRSRLLHCSAPIAHLLRPGQVIRVGDAAVVLNSGDGGHEVMPGEPGVGAFVPGSVLRLEAAFAGASLADQPVFFRDVLRAAKLSRKAAESSTDPSLCAEARFVCGKAYHAAGSLFDAYVEYKRCTDIDPHHVPAIFGRAQFMMNQKRPKDAKQLAEQVLARQADNADALVMLSRIERAEHRFNKATKHAKRATEVSPTHQEAWLLLAELLSVQRTKPALKEATVAYKRAGKLLRETVNAAPFELWANLGALEHALGSAQAQSYYRAASLYAAAEAAPDQSDDEKALEKILPRVMVSPRCVTLAYNMARLLEDRGDTLQAKLNYEALLKRYPGYTDCAVRLGLLAQRAGEMSQAKEWFSRAVEASHGGAHGENALTVLARWHEEEGDLDGAKAKYNNVIGARAPKDKASGAGRFEHYAELAKANIYFGELYRDPRLRPGGKSVSKRDAVMKRAFDGYKSVLKVVPGNVYAANGMGMILAEQGRVDEAREVFRAAREAMLDAFPVAINLAHTELALGAGDSAIQLYRHVLRKFARGSPLESKVLLYLARACVESKKLEEARKALQEALLHEPQNWTLWFNMSYVMAEEAVAVLRVSTEAALSEVERAARYLDSCVRRLQWLSALVTERTQRIQEADAAKAQVKAMLESDPSASVPAETRALIDEGERLHAEAERDLLTEEKVSKLLQPAMRNQKVTPQHVSFGRSRAAARAAEARKQAEALEASRKAKEEKLQEQKRLEEEKRARSMEVALALQARVPELIREEQERRARQDEAKKTKSRATKTSAPEYDPADVMDRRTVEDVRLRRSAFGDDATLSGPIRHEEELSRLFVTSFANLSLGDSSAAGDAAAASAPSGDEPLDWFFQDVPSLPTVDKGAPVHGGYARLTIETTVADDFIARSDDEEEPPPEFEDDDEDYGGMPSEDDAPALKQKPTKEKKRRRRGKKKETTVVASSPSPVAVAEAAADDEEEPRSAKRKPKRRLKRAADSDEDSDSGRDAPQLAKEDSAFGAMFDAESDSDKEERVDKREREGASDSLAKRFKGDQDSE
jgi:RNA polymerase-associated protein CTR9